MILIFQMIYLVSIINKSFPMAELLALYVVVFVVIAVIFIRSLVQCKTRVHPSYY